MRSQKQWPADPQQHLVDFFGQYRDPMWDNMDEWRKEMDDIRTEVPGLHEQIQSLEATLALERRRTWAFDTYKTADPDVTVSSN